MNTMRLFRRLVFAQVLLGIVASCIAERNPGLLLVAGAVGAMSWYVTEGPGGRAIPRWLVNAGALAAVGFLAFELVLRRTHVVSAMGHFTMALQLLMLYTRKTDREYSQLLVLSLLQMIGASVLSVSMMYGVFLAGYCVVALATVLLFHLTATAEGVHRHNLAVASGAAAFGGAGEPPPRPNATAGRVARRQLRGVGVVVGLVCALVAAAVFVVTPRSGESAISLTPASGAAPAQAGFSNVVRLGVGPIGTGSREPMLNVKIESGGQALGWEDDPWLVRGAALDQYNPENDTWFRSQFAIGSDQDIPIDRLNARSPRPDDRRTIYTAEVSLRDARQRHIFSVVPVPTKIGASGFDLVRFESEALGSVAFSPIDQQLRATASVVGAATYRLSWPISSPRVDRGDGSLGSPPSLVDLPPGLLPSATRREPLYHYGPGSDLVEDVTVIDAQTYARRWTVEAERVRGLARRVLAQAGIERDPDARHTPEDLRVASVLGEYLRRGYRYDLANPPVRGGRDPVIEFLFETRRGHCELFAAGLIALCRSVGVPARMVTGFRASEFNTLGGYYVVRQSNAHAWVEVDGGPGVGWYTFDATPPERVEAQHRAPDGLFASLREFYEHLEFAWIRTVVAFDGRTQEAVLDNVAASVGASRARGEALAGRFVAWVRSLPRVAHLNRGEALVLVLCSVGLLIAAGLLVRIAWVRRRRLVRLQLTSLPPERRRGLSRRLGFYLAMLDLLERRGYRRPAWQSPSAFAHELAEANPLRFDPVVALTELFYEVRFGHRELDDDRKRRAKVHLKRLEQSVAGPVD